MYGQEASAGNQRMVGPFANILAKPFFSSRLGLNPSGDRELKTWWDAQDKMGSSNRENGSGLNASPLGLGSSSASKELVGKWVGREVGSKTEMQSKN